MALGKTKKRISKDEYFLKMADVVCQRGTCPRLAVGSVLVKDGMVLSTGYNGAPRGLPHCIDVGCRIVDGHCARVVHSEVNAILQAAYHGTPTAGSTLYTQYLPCEHCAKTLVNAGIVRIVFRDYYKNADNAYTKSLFKKAKVKILEVPKNNNG